MGASRINADELFTSTIGEIPRTAGWASDRLAELTDGGGILKRLMAAVRSGEHRGLGAGEWSFTPSGPASLVENGAVEELRVDGVFIAESSGGHWSARKWRFECPIQVSVDVHGVESITGIFGWMSNGDGTQGWRPTPGRVVVSSRDNDDKEATEFTGTSVTNFACEILKRCVTHSWADSLTWNSTSRTNPEWHSRAVEGLAQLVYDLDERSESSRMLVQYLSGNMHVASDAAPMVLDEVLRSIRYAFPDVPAADENAVESAFDAWKADAGLDLADAITGKLAGFRWQPADGELSEIILDATATVSRDHRS